jgi:hypothetical protein
MARKTLSLARDLKTLFKFPHTPYMARQKVSFARSTAFCGDIFDFFLRLENSKQKRTEIARQTALRILGPLIRLREGRYGGQGKQPYRGGLQPCRHAATPVASGRVYPIAYI